jgi:hypothetical protein
LKAYLALYRSHLIHRDDDECRDGERAHHRYDPLNRRLTDAIIHKIEKECHSDLSPFVCNHDGSCEEIRICCTETEMTLTRDDAQRIESWGFVNSKTLMDTVISMTQKRKYVASTKIDLKVVDITRLSMMLERGSVSLTQIVPLQSQ